MLSCDSTPEEQIRLVLNDAVVSLEGVEGCPSPSPSHKQGTAGKFKTNLGDLGLCPLDAFVAAQTKRVETTDWDWACHGNWSVPRGEKWSTNTGEPPEKN